MAGKSAPRALPLQLLDEEGRVVCRGLATLWTSTTSAGSRWGGEFFQLTEGDPPRGSARARVRTNEGEDYPVVTGGREEVWVGASHQVRMRFGGVDERHP